ncbi:hypothetical protein BH09PSE3_BH09PSE3_03550 [soil metagenome]
MALTLDDLVTSPDHYLHSFEGDNAIFVPMDRAAYHRSIFLDDRISAASPGSMRIPLALLPPAARNQMPVGWIFHVAHCGSTLLARALDQIDTSLVLREPLALRQLAVAPDADRAAIVRALLSKSYAPGMSTIIKANVPVNFVIADIADSGAHAIMLYCGLHNYILAVLRSPSHRAWLGHVSDELKSHIDGPPVQNDGERAAALWLAQTRAFSSALETMPNARTLNADVFFRNPYATLRAAAAHMNIAMTDSRIEEIVAGPLFATDAKRPTLSFDNAARQMRNAALEITLADALENAQRWLEKAGGSAADLDRPLI